MTYCLPIAQRQGVLQRQIAAVRPSGFKRSAPKGIGTYSRQLLATDPIGDVTLTFPNVKAGSEIHIYAPDGTEIVGVESAIVGQQLTLQRYPSGSANNTVRIFICSLAYEDLDFNLTLSVSSDIPTFQRPDRNYRNPA